MWSWTRASRSRAWGSTSRTLWVGRFACVGSGLRSEIAEIPWWVHHLHPGVGRPRVRHHVASAGPGRGHPGGPGCEYPCFSSSSLRIPFSTSDSARAWGFTAGSPPLTRGRFADRVSSLRPRTVLARLVSAGSSAAKPAPRGTRYPEGAPGQRSRGRPRRALGPRDGEGEAARIGSDGHVGHDSRLTINARLTLHPLFWLQRRCLLCVDSSACSCRAVACSRPGCKVGQHRSVGVR